MNIPEIEVALSSDSPQIANWNGGLTVTAFAPGFTGLVASWSEYFGHPEPIGTDLSECILEGGTADCNGSMEVMPPQPHHVRVIVDQLGFPTACPSTGLFLRQIKVQVVSSNNVDVTSAFSVAESFTNLTNNTCGNGQPVPSSCAAADSGGQFLDSMAVSKNLCNSGINRDSGCGYTLTSTWSVCSGGNSTAIWKYNGETRSNVVKVNGQASMYQPGTELFP